MAGNEKPQYGRIAWTDITVPDADALRDFYASVVGWQPEPVDMGGYSDYTMKGLSPDEPAAGICHARGPNADLPAQWLIYILVEDLDASMSACTEGGGEIIAGPKSIGDSRYCVIRDPAGAVAALFCPPTPGETDI